jgi:hypothetical protein
MGQTWFVMYLQFTETLERASLANWQRVCLACIRMLVGSSFGLDTNYPDRFSVVLLSPSRQILG